MYAVPTRPTLYSSVSVILSFKMWTAASNVLERTESRGAVAGDAAMARKTYVGYVLGWVDKARIDARRGILGFYEAEIVLRRTGQVRETASLLE